MENHIVRIYRRDESQPDTIVGLVETVETGEIRTFRTLGELTWILARTTTITDVPCHRSELVMAPGDS